MRHGVMGHDYFFAHHLEFLQNLFFDFAAGDDKVDIFHGDRLAHRLAAELAVVNQQDDLSDTLRIVSLISISGSCAS
jgi:hypothetical protein